MEVKNLIETLKKSKKDAEVRVKIKVGKSYAFNVVKSATYNKDFNWFEISIND